MVGVVVDHPDALDAALGLEPAADAGEPRQPLQQAGRRQAELQPGGQRTGRVEQIVPPGYPQGQLAQSPAADDHFACGAGRRDHRELHPDVGVHRLAIGGDPRCVRAAFGVPQRGDESGRAGVVQAGHHKAVRIDTVEEPRERGLDVLALTVVVKMIGFHIGDERAEWL